MHSRERRSATIVASQKAKPHQPNTTLRQGRRRDEDALRIDQRNADRERIADILDEATPIVPVRPMRQFAHVRRNVADQQIGRINLGEKTNGFVLSGLVVAVTVADHLPDALTVRRPSMRQTILCANGESR